MMQDSPHSEEEWNRDESEEAFQAQRRLRQQLHEEKAFYMRLVKVIFMLVAFWLFMLWLIEEHDVVLFVGGLVLFSMFILYLLYAICVSMYDIASASREIVPTCDDDDDDDDEQVDFSFTEDNSSLLQFPMEQTEQRVQNCPMLIESAKNGGPTNGTYTAVYASAIYNRSVRSAGQLELQFIPVQSNGWAIEGISVFAEAKTLEGFCNAKGELYFVCPADESEESKKLSALYRGVLDFKTSSLFDGEFRPNSGPDGRIVRIELEKPAIDFARTASRKNSNKAVEMVALSSFNEEDFDDYEEENVETLVV